MKTFKLEVQRPGQSRPTIFKYDTREQMIKAMRNILKEPFAGNMEPLYLENGVWSVDSEAFKLLDTAPVVEQQMLLSQASELLAQLAKSKAMLTLEQQEELIEMLAPVVLLADCDIIQEEQEPDEEQLLHTVRIDDMPGLNYATFAPEQDQ